MGGSFGPPKLQTMLILEPKVNYLKGHRLTRFRSRDKNGASLWRAIKFTKNIAKGIIKTDTLDRDYMQTSSYLVFEGDYDYGYVEK